MAGFNLDNYVDVQDRINKFWSENENGRIFTEIRSDPDNFTKVVFFAAVYKDNTQSEPDSTGWAGEEQGQGGMVNKTSWHENCETSAIGRALANMGYATSREDRPSRQEMQKVQRMSNDYQSAPVQDAPVRLAQPQQQQRPANDSYQNGSPQGMTDRQMSFIRQMAREKGISDQGLDQHTMEIYGKPFAQLDRRDASSYIERLKSGQPINQT